MSPITLSRILDSEAKTPNSQDAFTAAELLQGLTGSIFSEIDGARKSPECEVHRSQAGHQQPPPQLAAALLRAPGRSGDGQHRRAHRLPDGGHRGTGRLGNPPEANPRGQVQLDTYTRSHLGDLATRILKVLDARPIQPRP